MEGHKEDCKMVKQAWINSKGQFLPEFAYRLRPDYEPEKWWFDTVEKEVYKGTVAKYPAVYEVTAEYADYLRNKPDGEWELQIPKDGDDIMDTDGEGYLCGKYYITTDFGPHDRGYRWCKPKPDIAQLRRDLVEARARMMEATEAILAAKHRLDGALRPFSSSNSRSF
jgi:hypothetical protein